MAVAAVVGAGAAEAAAAPPKRRIWSRKPLSRKALRPGRTRPRKDRKERMPSLFRRSRCGRRRRAPDHPSPFSSSPKRAGTPPIRSPNVPKAPPSLKEMRAFKIGARARKFAAEGCPIEGYEILYTALAESKQEDPELHTLLVSEMEKYEKRLAALDEE